jgi:hypothetical protein
MSHCLLMTPSLTDALCTKCGLCCDGTLFADVELAGQAEITRLVNMGMDVEVEDRKIALLSQPCTALRGTRCGVYAHRPKCCRTFQCHLLQSAQRGAVTVERALEEIENARGQVRLVKAILRRLGDRQASLPIRERCAEALAAEGTSNSRTIQARAKLEAAMRALEKSIRSTFLGSGQRRG